MRGGRYEHTHAHRFRAGAAMTKPTILIVGGGTGGHVFPGLALAEALTALADVDVVFCGTDRGLEARVVPEHGFLLERLRVEPIQGGGLLRAARGGAVALAAMGEAFRTVRKHAPRVALSVGGYAAGPVSLAAAALGIPVAVLEPNRVAGLANRLLAPFASRAYVAWKETATSFRARTVRHYGVPLRPGFFGRPYIPHPAGTEPRILVVGGSQGSAPLNERMPAAVGELLRRIGPVAVIHQAGRDRDAQVRNAYASHGVTEATVVAFIDDVARALSEADVVVSRAGAVMLAEITAIGRASVLVPFPDAADDHQLRNADALARLGGAVCINQKAAAPTRLAAEIARLLRDDRARIAMDDRSRACGRPGAARDVADDLLALAQLTPAEPPRRGRNNGVLRHDADDAGPDKRAL